ncbi:thermonuclease family protein [Xanthomonas albilineans]|uniref:thermonuclease family protein n=1 Tax=Xanthomonas albilineans TaxID=29447 RepID=UPI0009BBE80C|nr:thermonuclease family protein [Xanthomonas albilineans]
MVTRLAVLFALFLVVGAARADFRGRVIAVVDGDTLDVLVDRRPQRVRLAQIDAPESTQAFGPRARQTLDMLVYRKDVAVVETGRDHYGRTLGTVYIGKMNVNTEMVKQGMAWVYRRYVTDLSLLRIEGEAKRDRRGLWADPSPVPPWEFRHAGAHPQTAPH